jgi:D-aminopeptidase
MLTVERSSEQVTNFRIDTTRTRNLNFTREIERHDSKVH